MTAVDFATRRFQSAAAHYLAGRSPYPTALIDRTAERLGLTPDHRLLDLGCGPGQLAIAFSPFVGSVLAMDPEPMMLDIARRAAAGVENMAVAMGGSDDLGPDLGPFQAVVIGRAFHWMDREPTLQRFETLIEPTGAVVLFRDHRPEIPENEWLKAFAALVKPYVADDPARQRRRSPAYRPHVSVLLDSVFSRLEQISIIAKTTLTVDRLVDRTLSLSSTSRARLGDRADDLIEAVRREAPKWGADGTLEEVIASEALIARRP